LIRINNKNKTSYGPKDVLVFSFDSLYFYPKTFNVTKKKSKDAFMCLLSDDQLKVYLHRFYFNNSVVVGSGTAYILEKTDGESVQIIYDRRFNLKKHAGDFFKDCPHISEKINNKTYKVALEKGQPFFVRIREIVLSLQGTFISVQTIRIQERVISTPDSHN
jgi:hypothetical protein